MNDIDVQNLIDRIKGSVNEHLDRFVFEPFDDLTRKQIAATIESYLADLKAGRFIADFGVVCSEANNPPMSQDNGELIVDFFIRPISFTDDLIHFHTPLSKGLSMATAPSSQSFPSFGTTGQSQAAAPQPWITSAMAAAITAESLKPQYSTSSDLPSVTLLSYDAAGNRIEMRLEPEASITAHESTKLLMLVISALYNGDQFSSYEYVRKNDLERHFKFKQVG